VFGKFANIGDICEVVDFLSLSDPGSRHESHVLNTMEIGCLIKVGTLTYIK
jgi:hypothetical protein